ncbi:hypothetical protein ZWY2020_035863 [Hordeum vulgare]|nr:hypothetical protein ZWY2020_035863 [Hordeum vulgare]
MMANGEASDDNGHAVEVAGGEDTLPVVLYRFVDRVWPPPGNGGDPNMYILSSSLMWLPLQHMSLHGPRLGMIFYKTQTVHFDKITARLKKLSYGLSQEHCDPVLVAQKVCAGVYMGVTTSQLDELIAETAATLRASQPDYASVHSLFRFVSPLLLAARIVVSNLPPSG